MDDNVDNNNSCNRNEEDEELLWEKERRDAFNKWVAPFSEEATCGLDPFDEIRTIRSTLNSHIFRIERHFPYIRCRNLQDIDSFFTFKKTILEAKAKLSVPNGQSSAIELTEDQKHLLPHLPFIETDMKEIGNLMRRLHALLLKEGLLVKKVRRRLSRKKKRKLSEGSQAIEESIEADSASSNLDLNVSLPPRPLLEPRKVLRAQEVDDSESEAGEEETENYFEFDSDKWLYQQKFGYSF